MSCGHPSCRVFGDKCESCARRRRYGILVGLLAEPWLVIDQIIGPDVMVIEDVDRWHAFLDGLDALAGLMEDRHRLIRLHRRELFEEQREAQRGARDAYDEGRHEGARGERW